MIPIMWLVGHQWLADGGDGKDSQNMHCVNFLQTILYEKLMGMTTVTSVALKMKNLPSQLVLACILISLTEHLACRYELETHQDGLPLLLELDLSLNFRVHARISHWLFMCPMYALYMNCYRKKKKKKSQEGQCHSTYLQRWETLHRRPSVCI